MTQTNQTEKIEIELDQKKVVYDTRSETWTWDGIKEEAVKKLNPKKHEEIREILEKEVKEFQEKLKREEEERRQKKIEENRKTIEEFKKKVTPMIDKKYTLTFGEPDGWMSYHLNFVRIERNKVDAELYYDGTVMPRDCWRPQKTGKPWVVDFDYKKIRYATIEKAIKKACERIEEKIEQNQEKLKEKQAFENKNMEMAEELKKHGIGLVVEKEGRGYGRHRNYYDTRTAIVKIKDKEEGGYSEVKLKGHAYSSKGKIEVNGIKITGKFTPEQVKKLADTIASMNPERDYE